VESLNSWRGHFGVHGGQCANLRDSTEDGPETSR
jgi:hypothetical protein